MTKNEEIVGDAILEVLSGCGDVDIEAGIGWVFQEPLSPEAKVLRDKLGAIALGTNPWTAEPGEVFAHVKSLGDGSIFIHFPKGDYAGLDKGSKSLLLRPRVTDRRRAGTNPPALGGLLVCLIAVLVITGVLCVNAFAAIPPLIERTAGIPMAISDEPLLTESVKIIDATPNINVAVPAHTIVGNAVCADWHFPTGGQYVDFITALGNQVGIFQNFFCDANPRLIWVNPDARRQAPSIDNIYVSDNEFIRRPVLGDEGINAERFNGQISALNNFRFVSLHQNASSGDNSDTYRSDHQQTSEKIKWSEAEDAPFCGHRCGFMLGALTGLIIFGSIILWVIFG